MTPNVCRSAWQVPAVVVTFWWNLKFLYRFSKSVQISNITTVCPVGTELFYADGRTDMRKIIVALWNFANAPEERCSRDTVHVAEWLQGRPAGRLYGSTSISGGSKRFICMPKRLTQSVCPAACRLLNNGRRSFELFIQIHPVPRPRPSDLLPPFLQMPSWDGQVQLHPHPKN